ncbi:MAG: CotH kinase family protein [Defluviitaleaceae bacterium]|nr:CotH kinase family protein [Defluviitaleaceae bacterium]
MKKNFIYALLAVCLLLALVAVTVLFFSNSFRHFVRDFGVPAEFPVLHITAPLHPFLAERDYWHPGTLTLAGSGDDFAGEEIRLRGRGNSTWVQAEDKRPLRIRFETPRTLLSDYPHRDWVLVANHFDMSLLRNYAALYLGSLMGGMDHTPMVQNVQVYINGEYAGLFLLTDERDVAPGRSQLTFDPDPTLSEFYFELDGHAIGWRADDRTLGDDFFIVDGLAYSIRYPSGGRRSTAHTEYLYNFVTRANEAMLSHDFERIQRYIDIDSFLDFYVVQELFKNIDISAFSVFMQLRGQGDARRIYFGPVWDFDRSAGNTIHWYTHENIFAGWYNTWFRAGLNTPELAEKMKTRWFAAANDEILAMLSRLRQTRRVNAAEFQRDFDKFNLPETQPNWFYGIVPAPLQELTTWEQQADYLIQWLTKRRDWLNWYFNEN